jgi:hypothetical protein
VAWAQEEAPAAKQEEPEVPGPARCVERARGETGLSEHESVLLCRGAESDEPVDCFLHAAEGTFLEKHELLTLCSPIFSGRVLDPY